MRAVTAFFKGLSPSSASVSGSVSKISLTARQRNEVLSTGGNGLLVGWIFGNLGKESS